MARRLLLRENDAAMAILRQLLADGTLTQADVAAWFLFARLRDEGKLADLISG